MIDPVVHVLAVGSEPEPLTVIGTVSVSPGKSSAVALLMLESPLGEGTMVRPSARIAPSRLVSIRNVERCDMRCRRHPTPHGPTSLI